MTDLSLIAQRIEREFGAEFALADPVRPGLAPAFVHVASNRRFRYIAEGRFLMGLSEPEERAARAIVEPLPLTIAEMRPVHEEHVGAYLIAERPVLNCEFDPAEAAYASSAAAVTHDQAAAFCAAIGMSLPSEAQWERACRAGGSTLFTWGDQLPDEDELAQWLTYDFEKGNGRANAFGLAGLFVAEWCADRFRESYDAPTPAGDAPHVVRGGGAFFWPWQDEEWVWCMSAMRMPGTDLSDGRCGFRPVRNFTGEAP